MGANITAGYMTALTSELLLLQEWWDKNDPALANELNPGCSEADLERIHDALAGLVLPEDIRVLYAWHDGCDDEFLDIGTGAPFLSLQFALSERETMLESVGEDDWKSNWLPIFGEADEGLFIILGKSPREYSPIYTYNLQSDKIYLRYESLLGLVQTLRESYELGVFIRIDDRTDDFYEVYESDASEAIRKKFNPNAYPFLAEKGRSVFHASDLG